MVRKASQEHGCQQCSRYVQQTRFNVYRRMNKQLDKRIQEQM
jgi:hypothetical protein